MCVCGNQSIQQGGQTGKAIKLALHHNYHNRKKHPTLLYHASHNPHGRQSTTHRIALHGHGRPVALNALPLLHRSAQLVFHVRPLRAGAGRAEQCYGCLCDGVIVCDDCSDCSVMCVCDGVMVRWSARRAGRAEQCWVPHYHSAQLVVLALPTLPTSQRAARCACVPQPINCMWRRRAHGVAPHTCTSPHKHMHWRPAWYYKCAQEQ